MQLQALFTKSVIDAGLRFPQLTDMLTHDQIRAELIRQLESEKIKGVDVAAKLNIAPARITEIKKGERRIQQKEMPTLAELLGMVEPPLGSVKPIVSETAVPYLGEVAQGVWLEQSMASDDPTDMPSVVYDRMKGDPGPENLFAVRPVGTSMNLAFRDPRTYLICRRVPFTDYYPKAGEYVIVERTAHDLREYTCKRVEIDGDGVFWLHSESDDPRWHDPWRIGKPDAGHHSDVEITIIGKVIRAIQDYERPVN